MLLIIMRGLPGSGKSTLAAKLCEDAVQNGKRVLICSADQYFMDRETGEYRFDPKKLPLAHAQCQDNARTAMSFGWEVVIVDNTNTTSRECYPYVVAALEFGYTVEFRVPETPWAFDVDELSRRNTHAVPTHAIQRMRDRWVHDLTIDAVLRDGWR